MLGVVLAIVGGQCPGPVRRPTTEKWCIGGTFDQSCWIQRANVVVLIGGVNVQRVLLDTDDLQSVYLGNTTSHPEKHQSVPSEPRWN